MGEEGEGKEGKEGKGKFRTVIMESSKVGTASRNGVQQVQWRAASIALICIYRKRCEGSLREKRRKKERERRRLFSYLENSVHVNDSLHGLNVQQSAGDISVDKRSCSPGFTSHCAMPKQMQSATIHLWTDIVENPKVLSI